MIKLIDFGSATKIEIKGEEINKNNREEIQHEID